MARRYPLPYAFARSYSLLEYNVPRAKLKQVEADVKADPLALNRGLFFDKAGRHLRIDEVP